MTEGAAQSLRSADRYLLTPPLVGYFDTANVSICDVSARGARFRHESPLDAGTKAMLRFAVKGRLRPVSMEVMIVWTQPEPGKQGRYVSGLRTFGLSGSMDDLLSHLQRTNQTSRIEDLRAAERFVILPSLEASWNDTPAMVEDLSVAGARIATAESMNVGSKSTFRMIMPGTSLRIEAPAEVRWSSVHAVADNERTTFRAGLFIRERSDVMRLVLGHLCEIGRAAVDVRSLRLKLKIIRARARQLVPSPSGIESASVPAEQYLLIQGVREELRLNPDEAVHWYRRARISINDPLTRQLAPSIADHPDALAVWEYLDRSVDPTFIGRTFALRARD